MKRKLRWTKQDKQAALRTAVILASVFAANAVYVAAAAVAQAVK